jgi:Protein of unknown function (DUF2950)
MVITRSDSHTRKVWLRMLAALLVAAPSVVPAAPAEQRHFKSEQDAVDALVDATRGNQTEALLQILGRDGGKLIYSGDPVADRNGRTRFVAAYEQAHRIETEGPDKAVLVVGDEEWPLPIPLVRTGGDWHFDTKAGQQEILARRVGRNELGVLQVCRAYVQAQREYASLQISLGRGREYAQHFHSHAGMHDGLYWPVGVGEPESPLGPLVAQAQAAGYASDGMPRPYYGYYFRILRRQGAHAPGGAKDYIIDGHMTGGFALLAYPAEYGDSGVMTFMVNDQGIVFEKNLGPGTAALARAIEQYDPDESWRVPAD